VEILEQPIHASPAPSGGPTVIDLIRRGVVDAELGALLWLLVDGHVPVVVASPGERGPRDAALSAILDLLPDVVRRRRLLGEAETFAWLSGAAALGWSSPRIVRPGEVELVPPERTWLLAGELGPDRPDDTWGDVARVAVRAIGRGFALAATTRAGSLRDVLEGLGRPPVSLTGDEQALLGAILVLGSDEVHDDGVVARATAAHYVRPVERDGAGHLQRRPPAVLATRDEGANELEHYAWAVTAELAMRVGRSRDEFEAAQAARASWLATLAADPSVTSPSAARDAIARFREEHHE